MNTLRHLRLRVIHFNGEVMMVERKWNYYLVSLRNAAICLLCLSLGILASIVGCVRATHTSVVPAQSNGPPLELEYYQAFATGNIWYYRVLGDGSMIAACKTVGSKARDDGRVGSLSTVELKRLEEIVSKWDQLAPRYGRPWERGYKRVITVRGKTVVDYNGDYAGIRTLSDLLKEYGGLLPNSGLRAEDVWRSRWDPSWKPFSNAEKSEGG